MLQQSEVSLPNRHNCSFSCELRSGRHLDQVNDASAVMDCAPVLARHQLPALKASRGRKVIMQAAREFEPRGSVSDNRGGLTLAMLPGCRFAHNLAPCLLGDSIFMNL